jgi:predicted transcriptional regulator
MTTRTRSAKIVTPVEAQAAAGGGHEAVNPAALTVEQLARALGVPSETIRRHVEGGAPTAHDGAINLIQYAAWLNRRLGEMGEQE